VTTQPSPAPNSEPLIPPIGSVPQPERMFRVNWVASLQRSPSGAPLLLPEFVARQGRSVHLIDVRDEDELVGPLGHIPGAEWIPRERVLSLAERVPHRDTPLVLVSRGGERSAELAKALEAKGLRFVASMSGGMLLWKGLGFATSRDGAMAGARDVLRPEAPRVGEPKVPLGRDDVLAHVGDPHAIRWMKLAALLVHARLSCVDGRDETGVIGTPGADAGELLLGLGALERVLGRPLSDAVVDTVFQRHVDTFGRFHAHTDISAANRLIQSLRADRRLDAALAHVFETLEWRAFLGAPPVEVQPILLEHLLRPEAMGCGHLRLIVTRSEEYGVRRGLAEAFFRTFFFTRWRGSTEVELVPLPGGHAEGAVVNVRVEREVHPFSSIPLVSPMAGGTQMFVNHPQVAGFLRRQLAAFLAQQDDLWRLAPDGSAEAELLATMNELAGAQLGHTLSALAAGLPVFDVVFSAKGEPTVLERGHVPGDRGGAH
jgi:rhodanese-related sulfurtransferase